MVNYIETPNEKELLVGYEPLYIFSMLNFFKKKKAGAFLHQPYQN